MTRDVQTADADTSAVAAGRDRRICKLFVFRTSVNGHRRNLTCNCGHGRPDTDASL